MIKKATIIVEATTEEEATIMHQALMSIYFAMLAKKGKKITPERIREADKLIQTKIEQKNGLYIGTVSSDFTQADERLFKEGVEAGKKQLEGEK